MNPLCFGEKNNSNKQLAPSVVTPEQAEKINTEVLFFFSYSALLALFGLPLIVNLSKGVASRISTAVPPLSRMQHGRNKRGGILRASRESNRRVHPSSLVLTLPHEKQHSSRLPMNPQIIFEENVVKNTIYIQ